MKSTNAQRPTGSVNIWSEGVVYPCMKRLFALMFCVAVLGFVTVPTSKAQEFSISIGGDGYCYGASGYGYGSGDKYANTDGDSYPGTDELADALTLGGRQEARGSRDSISRSSAA